MTDQLMVVNFVPVRELVDEVNIYINNSLVCLHSTRYWYKVQNNTYILLYNKQHLVPFCGTGTTRSDVQVYHVTAGIIHISDL